MSKDHHHNDKGADGSPREYRLVPVEEWPTRGGEGPREAKIDVKRLSGKVWDRRMFVIKCTAFFVVVGLVIALLSPIVYQASASLLPENQSGLGNASGLLEQYGGLLGLGNSIQLDQEETIPPELYPDIVSSIPFQLEILNSEVYYPRYDTTVSNYAFFDDVYEPSFFSYVRGYTLGLPSKVIGLFSEETPEPVLPAGFRTDSIITLTKRQGIIVNKMRERINVVLDDESGLINVTVEMPDPNAAAQITQLSVSLLKEYVTNYRTRKAQEDLEFTQEQMVTARDAWEKAQARLAGFQDQNFGQLTAKAQTQEERLRSEYDLTFNKYNALAQKVEQAKLRVQEKTPVVTVLQPVQMPVDNAKPQRKLIVILSAMIGFILSAGYVIVKDLRQ